MNPKKRARGRPFEKGHKKLPGAGRAPGTGNLVTREVREFFRYLVSKPEVQAAFERGIIDGDRGALQAFLGAAAYVVGKPRETAEIDLGPRLAKLLLLAQDRLAERRRAKIIPIGGPSQSPSQSPSPRVLGSGSSSSGDPA